MQRRDRNLLYLSNARRVVTQDYRMEAVSPLNARRPVVAADSSEIVEWLEVTPAIQ
jgi:hypothetical protein